MKNQNNKSKNLKNSLQNLVISSIVVIFLIAILPVNGFAQLSIPWTVRYNGLGNSIDYANSITVDGAGNVYVTGQSTGTGTGFDYVTIKYNSGGFMQWVKRYEGLVSSSDDRAISIAVDVSGNVYVTGSSGTGSLSDYATIKYNSMGVVQWIHRFNGQDNGRDEAYSMAVDASGYVYVTGRSERSGAGTNADYATVKYSPTGIQQWVRIYNGPGDVDDDKANSIAVDQNGNVYVTGKSGGTGTDYDYATVKYNAFGTQLWAARYNFPNNNYDEASTVKVDGSGNVYVTGKSYGGNTNYDYATVKYNSLGVEQWAQRFNGQGNGVDVSTGLAIDASGNVYISGSSSSPNQDFATVKYNPSGISQWVQRYNGPSNGTDYANSLAMDNLGNIYVTGYSVEVWGGNYEYLYATVKYNPAGTLQWDIRYNGPFYGGYDVASAITTDGAGNVYVTGMSSGNGFNFDYATVKYSQSATGISPTTNEIPKDYSLSQNYPNPFNPTTNIKFSIPVSSNVKITVFDIQGKEVEILVNEVINAGVYVVDWNASALSSGTYFYTIKTESFTETKKMILVK